MSKLNRSIVLFNCTDGTRFHLGETTLNNSSDIIHADTLFSAIVNLYAMVYGEATSFIESVQEGRLRFSSGFHAVVSSWLPDKPIYFLPRPPIRIDDSRMRKEINRIRFVSVELMRLIGTALEPADTEDGIPNSHISLLEYPRIGTAYACTQAELGDLSPEDSHFLDKRGAFLSTTTQPRVRVRTTEYEGNFYHSTATQFQTVQFPDSRSLQGHFYILIEHTLESPEWNRLLGILRLLSDEGIGGERSCGYGLFDSVKLMPSPLGESTASRYGLTLAPIIPTTDSEFQKILSYSLMVRGGGSLGLQGEPAHHRKRVRMVAEGALLLGEVNGSIVDVSPDELLQSHPILRCGVNLSFPFGPTI